VNPRVLVVDDEAGVRYVLRELLLPLEVDVIEAAGGEEAIAALKREPYDLVITDLRMPQVDGMAVLDAARAQSAPPKVIVITAHGSERAAVEAMKHGAHDYFRKPFEPDELVAVCERALELVRMRLERDRLVDELALSRTMVFASPAMKRLATLVARVAPRDVNVLLTGESGTGKERVAEAIVKASPRADGPFVRFNAAALRPELAEAELFGHAKGAFTGASGERRGLFRAADGGTLLIDEIGDLDLETQARLLRVLQEGEVRPLGKDQPAKVDVRVLAATHHDLAARSAEGAFREDLYYRLNVVRFEIPPLRERPEDLALLAEHFLARFADRFGTPPRDLTPELLAALRAHDWPGNVRELQNAIEGLVAMSPERELDLSLLPGGEGTSGVTLEERMGAYERGVLTATLKECQGNRAEAARRLGIGRATLYEKLARHGIDRSEV